MTDAPKSKSMDKAALETQRTKALALKVKGWSYRAIAVELGYEDASGAHRAVSAALKETHKPARDEARAEYIEKFDRLERAAWPDALTGSAAHQKIVLELMRDRARMFGLDDPTQVEVNLAPVRDLFTQLIPLDEPEDAELVEDAEEVPPDDDEG